LIIPKVSICIPAYRQPELLHRTLQSVITQSFNDYEVIITDDTPDESIRNVLKEFLPNNNIRYYRNSIREGSPGNWNVALGHAQAEYIKMLHHDDWFSDKNSLSKFVKMLDDNPNADMAFSATNVCSNHEIKYIHSSTERQRKKLNRNPLSLFSGNFIGPPSTTIFRKKQNITFDPHLKWVVDIDFYIRILIGNKHFIYNAEPLVCTTVGASHQVTRECEYNRDVQLYEWIYLYTKVHSSGHIGFEGIKCIWNLLKRHNVESSGELRALGVGHPLPINIKNIILFQRLMKRFNKFFCSLSAS